MKRILSSALVLLSAALLAACAPAGQPIKTLLITGQNNHHWEVSHVAIRQILENSGLFAVDYAVSPPRGEDMSGFVLDFKPYDLVVVDYNGAPWPEETGRRFVEFTRSGGGVVIYHAANNAFPQWPEYSRICALGGWEGRDEKSGPWVYWAAGRLVRDSSPGAGGSHGRQHEYVLNGRSQSHPIAKGLPDSWRHAQDELYDRMRGPGDIDALLFTAFSDPSTGGSGREEPLIFTVKFGKGRVFHTMLGHVGPSLEDNPAMQCTGFQVLLLRGAEWAATGQVAQQVPPDFPTATQISLRKAYKHP